ncbi:MAG: porin family protein [Woeseiaceae bacterium]
MQILHNSLAILSLLAMNLAAAPAVAGERPFHVEASVGRTDIGDIDGFRVDDSATAFSLDTGYRFTDWFGVDAAYVRLGSVKSTIEVQVPVPIEASADGFEVVAIARAPLTSKIAVSARGGVMWWNSEARAAGMTNNTSGNDPTWGAGVEYTVRPTFSITARWTRHVVDDVDADTVWLGVMLHFGDVDSARQ